MCSAPPSSTASWTVTTCGWSPSRAISRASRRIRSRASAPARRLARARQRDRAVERQVVREPDLLRAAAPEQPLGQVAAGDRGRSGRRRRRGGGQRARRARGAVGRPRRSARGARRRGWAEHPVMVPRRRRRPAGSDRQDAGEIELRVPRLEAALERGPDPGLRLGLGHALAEAIGVAAEVVDRRERDGVDALLDCGVAGGREAGDPVRQRATNSPSSAAGSARLIQP